MGNMLGGGGNANLALLQKIENLESKIERLENITNDFRLLVKPFEVTDIIISKGDTKSIEKNVELTGYKAIALGNVAILNHEPDGVNSSHCNAYYQEFLDDWKKILFFIKNFNTNYDARVDVRFTVVYQHIEEV